MAKEGKISPPLSPAPRVMAVSRSFHQKLPGLGAALLQGLLDHGRPAAQVGLGPQQGGEQHHHGAPRHHPEIGVGEEPLQPRPHPGEGIADQGAQQPAGQGQHHHPAIEQGVRRGGGEVEIHPVDPQPPGHRTGGEGGDHAGKQRPQGEDPHAGDLQGKEGGGDGAAEYRGKTRRSCRT